MHGQQYIKYRLLSYPLHTEANLLNSSYSFLYVRAKWSLSRSKSTGHLKTPQTIKGINNEFIS